AAVQTGDANGSDSFNPDTEWTCFNVDDVSNLGSHTGDCASISPTIMLSTNSLTGLNYVFGTGPSAEQTFTAEGSNLTANILLTAPANFEISTTSGAGFSNTVTLPQVSGTVSATIIYVRLLTGLAINTYTGNLAATSTGATTQNVSFNGEVTCVPTQTITSFVPTSGPIGTEVTITGTGFSAASTVDFNGVAATVTFVNSTTLIAEILTGATTGSITVTESGCSLDSSSTFTVLEDNGCIGGSIPAGWTDLMFTGVYDDVSLSCHYFEFFNPTASDIDLSAYTIGFDNNFTYGSAVPTSGFTGLVSLSGIIKAESTFMVQVTTIAGGCSTCPTIVPDAIFIASLGINTDDRLVLVKDYGLGTVSAQDVWQNHTGRPGYDTAYNTGYIYSRNTTATAPSTTFDFTNDWTSSGTEDCFGFALSSAILPTINTQPTDTSGCYSASFTVAATAGNGGALTYQWKYNDGSAVGWTNVISTSFSPATVTGETTTNLTITGFDLDGYQFYCEVTENGACSVSSDAAQATTQSATWDGTAWSTAPSISTVVTINGNYNTGTNGSFSACSLIVNTSFSLTVDNATYVEVENDVTANGSIVVETQGSFVQNNDNASFTVNAGGSALVNKTTALLNNWYEYTYWSSPVFGETIGNALAQSPVSRRFWFNAQNYLDQTAETGNNNATVAGQDDIDDNGDDWQYANAADVMTPGVGYAATQSSSTFTQYNYTFTGPFNNGVITVPVYRNDTELLDTNLNFIGNPYASAVDADIFFNTNALINNANGALDGVIYLWSQFTPPSNTANGNQTQNFAISDYAIINGAGEAAGGDGVIPTRFIPSGQGFFTSFDNNAISSVVTGNIKTSNVIFNNSMRVKAGNNQFFKISKTKKNTEANRVWINLTSDNGIFNQLVIAYIDGATDANDGAYYDAKRSSGTAAIIYSLIEGDENKFAIQGKNPASLNLEEKIQIGFKSNISSPTMYKFSIAQLEGDFFTNNTIFLKDNLFNNYHDLTSFDYEFTSEVGEFNNRFEIVFKDGNLPINNLNPDELVIVELNDGSVQFTVKDTLTIKKVTIIDILGRTIYTLKGSSYTEIYNLSRLSKSIYIAKVELLNGQVIIKKAIKNIH
ncbi:IPT/TIG domain-containing protein, partial [Lutibacter sp.]